MFFIIKHYDIIFHAFRDFSKELRDNVDVHDCLCDCFYDNFGTTLVQAAKTKPETQGKRGTLQKCCFQRWVQNS